LKLDLKHWNKEVFENVEEKKKALMEEIQPLDLLQEERPLAKERERERERVKRAFMKADLDNIVLMQEVSWRENKGDLVKIRGS